RLRALYCVSTSARRKPLLMQLDKVKSMMRYRPPKGTAGLARSRVRGSSRVPLPPARIKVSTSFTVHISGKRQNRFTILRAIVMAGAGKGKGKMDEKLGVLSALPGAVYV